MNKILLIVIAMMTTFSSIYASLEDIIADENAGQEMINEIKSEKFEIVIEKNVEEINGKYKSQLYFRLPEKLLHLVYEALNPYLQETQYLYVDLEKNDWNRPVILFQKVTEQFPNYPEEGMILEVDLREILRGEKYMEISSITYTWFLSFKMPIASDIGNQYW